MSLHLMCAVALKPNGTSVLFCVLSIIFYLLYVIYKYKHCSNVRLCSDLIAKKYDVPELLYLNRSVDPCDNFYEFACGNFKNVKPMPDGVEIWDHFTILQDEIDKLMMVILKSDRDQSEPVALQKAKAAYQACTNVEYLDQLGAPERHFIKEIGSWPLLDYSQPNGETFSWTDVGDLIAKYGLPFFFKMQVIPNLFNASENVIYLSQDSVTNPAIYQRFGEDYDYFSDLEETQETKREIPKPLPYQVFLNSVTMRLRNLLGVYKPDIEIDQGNREIMDFMLQLKRGGLPGNNTYPTSVEQKTVEQLQNWTNEELENHQKIEWLDFFNHVLSSTGVQITNDTKLLVSNLQVTYGILNLISKTSPDILKNFMISRLLTYMAPDSDDFMRTAFDNFYKEYNWTIYKRQEYCLRKVLDYPNNMGLSFALTYEYQRYHFNINKLQTASQMIDDLYEAFSHILQTSDWLDDETKIRALLKAANMITLLGFPEFAADATELDKYYENLRICTWDHFGNSQRMRAFGLAFDLSQIGVPRNRRLWQKSPLTVNAFYTPQSNRITFPVSILNPSFYGGTVSTVDYGRIGAIIGHEITHGYDNQGRRYDEEGTVSDWWSPETEAKFEEKSDCFVKQYSKYYIPEIDRYVNANRTLRENIADNGGLREAYKAYKILTSRSLDLHATDEFTPDQLFFIGFGTMWCMTETNYYLDSVQKGGTYPPGRYRVIGPVSNMIEFSKAFGCPVGSSMNPEDKCILW